MRSTMQSRRFDARQRALFSLRVGAACGVALLCTRTEATVVFPGGQHALPTPPPNILLIVLDDIGIENLSFYNYDSQGGCPPVPLPVPPPLLPRSPPPTPRLTSLASHGVLFSRAYACPYCSVTRATILTGRHAFRTGMGYLADGENYSLPLSEVTIAEVLKSPAPRPPYRSGAFGKWHLSGASDPVSPHEQGFDVFAVSNANLGTGAQGHFGWYLYTDEFSPPTFQTSYSGSVVRQEAEAWIDTVPEPFFAYVAFHPAHSPFQVPPYGLLSTTTRDHIADLELEDPVHSQYLEGEDLGFIPEINPNNEVYAPELAYDWMIESVDTLIGELIDGIPAGKRSRTTILIVGDNGTPGLVIEGPHQSLHSKGTPFEQGTRVPFLASGYKVNDDGLRHEGVVSTTDLWRTCAALSGSPLPAGVEHDSISLKNVLLTPALDPRPWAFVQVRERFAPHAPNDPDPLDDPLKTDWRALNDGTLKYMRRLVWASPQSMPTEQEAAYRLTDDPTECDDLWPAVVDPSLPWITQTERDRFLLLKDELLLLSGP